MAKASDFDEHIEFGQKFGIFGKNLEFCENFECLRKFRNLRIIESTQRHAGTTFQIRRTWISIHGSNQDFKFSIDATLGLST